MKIRITLAGATGWVGRALIPAIAAASDLALTGAVARSAAGETVDDVQISATLTQALAAASDVVIDYTKPNVVKAHALEALAAGRHVVIGTSGLSGDDFAEIDAAARAASRGVLAAGNFSITATLLRRFALEAAEHVPDVEIIDYASARKPDTPSGTARELGELLSHVRREPTSRPVGELLGPQETRGAAIGGAIPVQVHSLRLPSFILSCEAVFGLPDERLVIRHDAGSSAAPYVAGTLLAVRKVSEFVGLRRGLDSLLG